MHYHTAISLAHGIQANYTDCETLCNTGSDIQWNPGKILVPMDHAKHQSYQTVLKADIGKFAARCFTDRLLVPLSDLMSQSWPERVLRHATRLPSTSSHHWAHQSQLPTNRPTDQPTNAHIYITLGLFWARCYSQLSQSSTQLHRYHFVIIIINDK